MPSPDYIPLIPGLIVGALFLAGACLLALRETLRELRGTATLEESRPATEA